MQRLEFIQALRGIAVLYVVIFHSRDFIDKFYNIERFGNEVFIIGNYGVDLFFLVSGYIMFYTTEKIKGGFSDLLNFLIKRLFRIIPIYYILTLIYYFINVEMYSVHMLIRSLTFIPIDGIPPLLTAPVLWVGWSLNYEIVFYVLFAFFLLFRKYRIFYLSIFIFSNVFFLPILLDRNYTFSVNYHPSGLHPILVILVNPLMLYFLTGGFLYYLFKNEFIVENIRKKKVFCKHLASLFIILSIYFIYLSSEKYFGVVLLFVSFQILHEVDYKFKPSLLWIGGDISYSLYLVHIIIRDLTINFFNYKKLALIQPSFFIINISLSVLFASLFYLYLEKPIYNFFLNKLIKKDS